MDSLDATVENLSMKITSDELHQLLECANILNRLVDQLHHKGIRVQMVPHFVASGDSEGETLYRHGLQLVVYDHWNFFSRAKRVFSAHVTSVFDLKTRFCFGTQENPEEKSSRWSLAVLQHPMGMNEDTSHWQRTPKGYCTEMSLLDAGGARAFLRVKLPNNAGNVPFNTFEAVRDREGEVTHWKLTRGSTEFVIFND
jgi:hypothetical protein